MRHSFPLILALGLGWPLLAGAEEPQMDTLLGLSLEELLDVPITTASRREESIRETPATVMVITRRQIEERRYRNLIDLLQDLPGVEVFRNSKSTLYHNLSFRGNEGNSRILILQDGVRVDSPSGAKIPLADNFPLYHAKQVEILYGPAAALYGADAFGGVVNIISEKGSEVNGLSFSTALGDNDAQYHTARAGMEFDRKLSLVAGAHWQDSRMDNLAAEYPASFPKVDAVTFGGQVVVPAAEREAYTGPTRSHGAFARLDWDKYLTVGYNRSFFRHLTSTGDRPDTAFYLDEAQWNTILETVYGKLRFDLSERLSAELTLERSVHEIDPNSKFYNIYVDFLDEGYEYARSRKLGSEAQFEYRLHEQHTLIGGLSHADYYSLPQVPDLPQAYDRGRSPHEQNLYYPRTDLPIEFIDADYGNTAAYLQWQAAWNARLSTTLGLRYDDNSRYQSTVNPRLGLVYQFSPATLLKVLYGEAFRAPTTDESLSTFGVFSGQRNAADEYLGSNFRVPNYHLEPETSRNLEFSLSHALTPEADISLNGFYAEIDKLIATRSEAVSTQFIPGASLSRTTVKDNLGSEHHYGLDLVFNWRYRLSPAWKGSVWSSYSYIDGKIQEAPDRPEIDLPYLTPHKLKFGTTLTFQDRYFITPKLSLFDRGRSGRANRELPGERLETPAYLLADLHLGAREMYRGLSAYLDIYNLFDRHYTVPAGSASTTFVGMPQQTRSLMFTLHYQFK